MSALWDSPDSEAGSGLNGRFDGAKSRLLPRAAGDEQNVIGLHGNVLLLPLKEVLNIYRQLFPLIGFALQAQNSGMPRVSATIEPFG